MKGWATQFVWMIQADFILFLFLYRFHLVVNNASFFESANPPRLQDGHQFTNLFGPGPNNSDINNSSQLITPLRALLRVHYLMYIAFYGTHLRVSKNDRIRSIFLEHFLSIHVIDKKLGAYSIQSLPISDRADFLRRFMEKNVLKQLNSSDHLCGISKWVP